jgi:hypothetical protein
MPGKCTRWPAETQWRLLKQSSGLISHKLLRFLRRLFSVGVMAYVLGKAGGATARSESIEVDASHCGMGANPAVAYAIADRLSQPEGAWRPFTRMGWRSLVYPDPNR